MKSLARCMLALCATTLLALPALAQVRVKLEPVAEGLVHPLVMAWPDDGTKRRFITEQTGGIWIQMPNGKLSARPFLDLAGKIEQVLTDAALAQRLRATGWDVVREHFDLGQNVARLIELWGTPGAPRAPSS